MKSLDGEMDVPAEELDRLDQRAADTSFVR